MFSSVSHILTYYTIHFNIVFNLNTPINVVACTGVSKGVRTDNKRGVFLGVHLIKIETFVPDFVNLFAKRANIY